MKQAQEAVGVRATIAQDLRAAFRGLSLGKEQRTLAVQAVVIGIVVWIAILALLSMSILVQWIYDVVSIQT